VNTEKKKPDPEVVDRRVAVKREFENAKAKLEEIDRQLIEQYGPGTYYGNDYGIEIYPVRGGHHIRSLPGF